MEIKDVKQFEYLWKNNGSLGEGSELVTLTDALSVPNAPVLMPKVISNIVKEAAEPLLIGTSLLQRINYKYGQTITFPAVGALQAADIAEGMEYPETSPSIGGAQMTATIGKSGLAVKVTDEMIRYSQYDVIGMMLRKAGQALARHKEVKIFNHIRALGVPVFDNVTPTRSYKGVTTGRDLSGAGNGSLTMDDLFDCFAQILTQGFYPNTLLMHPLAWSLFVKDATMRQFVLGANGGNWFAPWSGQPYTRAPWENSGQGGMGMSSGQTVIPANPTTGETATDTPGYYPFTQTSAPVLPSYANLPFRIIVSHFVPFDARRKLTDIYMFDSSELGVLIVDEDIMTEEFDDPKVDIRKIKLRERYAIGILNEGKAIAKIMNVHCVPNEVVLPAQATLDVSGSVLPIHATESVL